MYYNAWHWNPFQNKTKHHTKGPFKTHWRQPLTGIWLWQSWLPISRDVEVTRGPSEPCLCLLFCPKPCRWRDLKAIGNRSAVSRGLGSGDKTSDLSLTQLRILDVASSTSPCCVPALLCPGYLITVETPWRRWANCNERNALWNCGVL